MGKSKKTGKSVFLIMALSLLLLSCAPHTAGDALEESEKPVSEAHKTENPAGEADSEKPGEGAAGEEIQTDREKEFSVPAGEEIAGEQSEGEDISSSAVYNAGGETTETDQSDSENKKEYVDRADDEGETVIPSN